MSLALAALGGGARAYTAIKKEDRDWMKKYYSKTDEWLNGDGLAAVDEVNDGGEIPVLDTSHVDQGVRVGILPQQVPEEKAGGGEEDPVGFNLLSILTCQGDIRVVVSFAEASECCLEAVLELVPLKTDVLRRAHSPSSGPGLTARA